jgi:hypothetical protein
VKTIDLEYASHLGEICHFRCAFAPNIILFTETNSCHFQDVPMSSFVRRFEMGVTHLPIENLPRYVNYSIEVEAINKAGKSPVTQPVYVFMTIRGKLNVLTTVDQQMLAIVSFGEFGKWKKLPN